MRIERPAQFQLAGARGYVHSTQIFAHFTELVRELRAASAQVESARLFKFVRETSRNGRCVVALAAEIDAKAAASTIAFDAGRSGEMLLAFYDDGDEARRGGPDLVDTILTMQHTGDFAGRVLLRDTADPHRLFVNLIEANKALHNATLLKSAADTMPAYRFVYAENVPARSIGDDLELVFKARDVRNRGGHFYTLTEVAVAGCETSAPIRICFSY